VLTQPYPLNPFLNDLVEKLDQAWGLLGTITYGVFAFYLLLCVIKGNFKFGMRIFILFPIYPMKVGETTMNAFLFNTALVLICSVTITEFCTTAFSDYTNLTAINGMFQQTVTNLIYIKYVFLLYIYALFAMGVLTGIYLAFKPKEKPADQYINIS